MQIISIKKRLSDPFGASQGKPLPPGLPPLPAAPPLPWLFPLPGALPPRLAVHRPSGPSSDFFRSLPGPPSPGQPPENTLPAPRFLSELITVLIWYFSA